MISGHETKFMIVVRHFLFPPIYSVEFLCLWDNQDLKNNIKSRIFFLTESRGWRDRTAHTHIYDFFGNHVF